MIDSLLFGRRWRPRPCRGVPDGTILFDGVCVLCSGWVRFVAERDRGAFFRFAAVQGQAGSRLAAELGIDPNAPETNAVVVNGWAYFQSDAAIEVLRRLPGWSWAPLLRLVPRPVRDGFYRAVARRRYVLFGRTETCAVLPPGLRRRVIE